MENAVLMNQVHGNNVAIVSESDIGKVIPNCDGIITENPKINLVVRTADCLPILIEDKRGRIHGAVHAGWRGLQKKIAEKTIKLIKEKFKISPSDLTIKIGPHICVKHYEVKDDVACFFDEIIIRDGKKYLDLGLTAKNQLLKLGVLEKNIKIDKRCTFEDKSFPSYRRNIRSRIG